MTLFLEQVLNGLQFGVLLFLLSAGLTLVFGIMGLVNLAHGSLYMLGAYFAVTFVAWTESFLLGSIAALLSTVIVGILLERSVVRGLYDRPHLEQVLGTFGLILFFNELARLAFGPAGLSLSPPPWLAGQINVLGIPYPSYRLVVLVAGILAAAAMYVMIARTRAGMLLRAAAANRGMAEALGVNVRLLFLAVFALGAALSGLAGILAAPLLTVRVGMGEEVLLLAFVVVVIGGIGSIRGAFVAAVLIGLIDTVGRAYLPGLLRAAFAGPVADAVGPALASMLIYVALAVVLVLRPRGLFPTAARTDVAA
ncbi:MAG: branched-chain amino acid ABC transporter permease [Alphaproteobacteria bacterium]|nr:branched-chain amino acid ABC transporter permease [Alphaproteobacteria bacterium]